MKCFCLWSITIVTALHTHISNLGSENTGVEHVLQLWNVIQITTANSTNIWTYWRHRCTGHMNEEKNISSRQALDTCHRRNWFILLVFIIGKHNPQLEKSTSCPGRLLAATQWRVSQDSQVAVSACAWCDYPGIDMSHNTQYTQQIHFWHDMSQ